MNTPLSTTITNSAYAKNSTSKKPASTISASHLIKQRNFTTTGGDSCDNVPLHTPSLASPTSIIKKQHQNLNKSKVTFEELKSNQSTCNYVNMDPPPLPGYQSDLANVTSSIQNYSVSPSLVNFSHFDVQSLYFNYDHVKSLVSSLHTTVNSRTGASAAIGRNESCDSLSVTLPVMPSSLHQHTQQILQTKNYSAMLSRDQAWVNENLNLIETIHWN